MTSDASDDRRIRYERELGRRRRSLTWQVGARTFTMQTMWVVVLAAGAAVPLSAALGWPSWAAPILGFVVVVATGLEKIFRRTTDAAVAVDTLRRRLDRERRAFDVGTDPDGVATDDFAQYVRRCEEAIAEFDRQMIASASTGARGAADGSG